MTQSQRALSYQIRKSAWTLKKKGIPFSTMTDWSHCRVVPCTRRTSSGVHEPNGGTSIVRFDARQYETIEAFEQALSLCTVIDNNRSQPSGIFEWAAIPRGVTRL